MRRFIGEKTSHELVVEARRLATALDKQDRLGFTLCVEEEKVIVCITRYEWGYDGARYRASLSFSEIERLLNEHKIDIPLRDIVLELERD